MEVELHEFGEGWANLQIQRLAEPRRSRDNSAVKKSLNALKEAARKKNNVMPYLVDCCRSYANVGEMSNIFLEVYREHVEPSIFQERKHHVLG